MSKVIIFPARPIPASVKMTVEKHRAMQQHPKITASMSPLIDAAIVQCRKMNYIIPRDWR